MSHNVHVGSTLMRQKKDIPN